MALKFFWMDHLGDKMKFYLLNLGCAKNLVEGEHLAGLLMEAGWEPVAEPEQARALIVNTCGFIQPAVEESLEEVLALAQDKTPDQSLAVVGCLVGRYGKKLSASLPEADLLVSPGRMADLPGLLESGPSGRVAMAPARGIFTSADPRALTTGPGWAYLRVSDGCSHRCSYCTIPSIRGPLRSRSIEDLTHEARVLASQGVREINLIAQDLTAYGQDLGLEQGLANLIRSLDAVEELNWIRMLYLHPDTMDAELIETVAGCQKVLPYFDMPVQHCSRAVIQAMNRQRYGQDIQELIYSLRKNIPNAVIRTTIMVGHPGEGPSEFEDLLAFVKEIGFDHLGCFTFLPEKGTKSQRLPAPSPEEAKERYEAIMDLQQQISREKLAALKGSEQEILVLGPHPESELLWHGRIQSQAPDVDGLTIITEGDAEPGEIVSCRINQTHQYDLEASLL